MFWLCCWERCPSFHIAHSLGFTCPCVCTALASHPFASVDRSQYSMSIVSDFTCFSHVSKICVFLIYLFIHSCFFFLLLFPKNVACTWLSLIVSLLPFWFHIWLYIQLILPFCLNRSLPGWPRWLVWLLSSSCIIDLINVAPVTVRFCQISWLFMSFSIAVRFQQLGRIPAFVFDTLQYFVYYFIFLTFNFIFCVNFT